MNKLDLIPYGRQQINQDDIDAVVSVLQSDFLTQGPQLECFENAVKLKVGAEYGYAVNSATSALHIACLALDLQDGDWLWTSPITFVASANCGRYCGAYVDFVDIDPRSFNICTKALEKKLVSAEAKGKLPKVLVVVHMCGQSANMKSIAALAKRFEFAVIEDASHAIGGKYQDQYIGNSRYSDITVFSFHPVKIITTAEGGMALTNRKDLAVKLELYRSHGITRHANLMTKEPEGSWYYQQINLGFNYRMTELQAALGRSQLSRLDSFIAKRHQLADRYDFLLSTLPLLTPWRDTNSYSTFHLYVVRLCLDKLNTSRAKIFDALRQMGIGVNIHYIPVHTQPYYADMGFLPGDFPQSLIYYSEAISLPMYHGLTFDQQDKVIQALEKALAV